MINNSNLEFTTDKSGSKAVLISLKDWENIQKELKELEEYRSMKSGLKSAFLQVQAIKEGKLPRKTLESFLDEC